MRDDRHLLGEILEVAGQIQSFLANVDLDDYLEDVQCQWAVNLGFIRLGEAANNLSDETRSRIDQPWRNIIDYRHKVAHAYATVTPARTYQTATEALPALIAAVEEYLSQDRT